MKCAFLRYSPVRWLDSMSSNNKQIGAHRISVSSRHHTLLASTFAVLARELFDNLALLSHTEQQNWAQYVASHQSKDSGLFLDPLLRPDDLVGKKHDWQYCTWQFTFFGLAALDALNAKAPCPLVFLESFLATHNLEQWLESRNWSDPWLESNNIMFLSSFLMQEAERTQNPDYALATRTVFDWLDNHQNPETGYWDLGQGASLFNAMAGAFHFYFLYFYLGRRVNYIERIIDSTLTLQQPDGLFDPGGGGGACIDLDAVDILTKCSLLSDYRAKDIKGALTHACEAILKNQNADGGFCEAKRPPQWEKSLKRRVAERIGLDRLLNRPFRGRSVEYIFFSSWDKMRYQLDESDLWSTWFRSLALALISTRYPGEFIDNINWHFRRSPTLGWHDEKRLRQIRQQFYK